MSRNLLNFSNEVLVDMNGFNYNLMTEETENVPQEKKFSYNQPINIEKKLGPKILILLLIDIIKILEAN